MLPLAHLFRQFVVGSLRTVMRGGARYYAWLALLFLMIATGVVAYSHQLEYGLITSNMRDPLAWGLYIGSFAFFVGVAAAAVVLVIPAYVYRWGPLRDVVLLGELLSVAAIVMAMLFVIVDIGRPQFAWHMLPALGTPNFPHSLLVWDILVLTSYFAINYFIVTHMLFNAFLGRRYNANLVMPMVFLSIPLAIGIHTVTAFLFMGLKARPFWHTAILAPRFIASAFCSGPALLLMIFVVIRRIGRTEISDAALFKMGELLGYAMAVNLFFVGSEVFTEFYSPTAHVVHAEFQWFGSGISPFTWTALACNVTAFVIFIVPALRLRIAVLVVGCALSFSGVFIEKGMGLLLPGLTPDVRGEVYAYTPSLTELGVAAGVWGIGALLLTWMIRIANAIHAGELRFAPPAAAASAAGLVGPERSG